MSKNGALEVPQRPVSAVEQVTNGELTLDAVRAAILEVREAIASHGEKVSAAASAAEQAQLAANKAQYVHQNARDLLAAFELAKAEYAEDTKKVPKGGQQPPFVFTRFGQRISPQDVLTESQLDELRDAVAPAALAAQQAKAAHQALAVSVPKIHQQLAHLVPGCRERMDAHNEQVAALDVLLTQARQALRTEDDADRLLAMRRVADEVPLRSVCARIAVIDWTLVWVECGGMNLRDSIGGYEALGKLREERAELQQQKLSQCLGINVRSALGQQG